METTFAEENSLSLLLVILTKALTREDSDRELKHTLSPHAFVMLLPRDISKSISIFSNHTELEKVYLHSWGSLIALFLNYKTGFVWGFFWYVRFLFSYVANHDLPKFPKATSVRNILLFITRETEIKYSK